MKEGTFLLIINSRNSGNEIAKYKKNQPTFTCLKLMIETLEQGGVILMSLLLTLNIFHIMFYM